MFSTLISARQLKENFDREHWVILDCRFDLADVEKGERSYHQAHIEYAQYVNLNTQLSGEVSSKTGRHPLPEIAKITQLFSTLGISESTQVVVYDDCSGAMAARAWWLLQWLGHSRVAVLDGGIQAWQKISGSCSAHVSQPEVAHFVRRQSAFSIVSTEQVCSGHYQLIDARASARFKGEVEPIDNVAGHIPNAINRPFTDNLDASGLFKDRALLMSEMQSIITDDSAHMCGSGVTACHNILAAVHAGLPASKLYVGSWSEWIRDGSRPVRAV